MDFVFAERYVVVNIPAAFVEAVAHDKVERRYRVIVGKVDKPSPTLTAYVTAVNLNPTWTVPLFTKNEIIRHMRRDPSYLSRMHMRVLGARDEELSPQSIDWSSDRSPNFTIRQDSGSFNALGNVKIDMPNPYSVYMHDTLQENCSRTIIVSTRTVARGSIMSAILQPGFWKMCRDGIATRSTRGSPPAISRSSICRIGCRSPRSISPAG